MIKEIPGIFTLHWSDIASYSSCVISYIFAVMTIIQVLFMCAKRKKGKVSHKNGGHLSIVVSILTKMIQMIMPMSLICQ